MDFSSSEIKKLDAGDFAKASQAPGLVRCRWYEIHKNFIPPATGNFEDQHCNFEFLERQSY